MQKTKVIAIPEVYEYLENLVDILYVNDYFGFEDAAVNYVKELIDDMQATLPIRLHKPAPKYFDKYGKDLYYATFKKSNRTTWYAFFTKHRQDDEIIYLVRYISNNHVTGQFLNID
jgi:hypothetical protein